MEEGLDELKFEGNAATKGCEIIMIWWYRQAEETKMTRMTQRERERKRKKKWMTCKNGKLKKHSEGNGQHICKRCVSTEKKANMHVEVACRS